MPHASLKLIPGVDQNRTEALNEAAIWQSNLIRFVPDRQGQGLPQKLGGWTKLVNTTSWNATVRALHSWSDLKTNKLLAVGTDNSVWVSKNESGAYATPFNIDPQYYITDLTVSVTTVSGSADVTINDTGSNISSYDSVYFRTPVSVNGVILSGLYSCKNPTGTSGSYTITATNIIGVPTPATASSTGGAVPTFTSDITPATPTILVTLNNHGLSVGSTFSVQVPTIVGTVEIFGDYIVTSLPVADPVNTFTIAAASAPTAAVTVPMNNSKASVIYFIGQQAIPPTGYGASGYGYFGYGNNIDPASASGRQYTGTTVSTVAGVTTVTLTGINVYVTPGTIVQDTAATPNQFTVTSAVAGTNSTFTFTGTPTGTTFTIVKWAFVMPITSSPDWSLDNWGEYLIASPYGGEIFVWEPAQNDGHLNVMPNAPLINEGFFTAMPERQIIAYGSTFTGFQDPLLIRWCDIGNFTSWVGTVTNQAGSYRIPKGSKIVGAMQGPQQGLIWTDLALWSMQYINLPLVYSFNEIAAGCGLIGRKAMGTLAGNVYWMSQSQFFKLSGNGVETVQCPIWDVIFQDIDTDYWQNVRCAPNSRFSEISWYYPTLGSNGIPTKYAKYNTVLNQWDYGTLTRTAWIDQSEAGPPIGAGGNYSIYQHETSNSDDGAAMNSYFQTGYFAIQDGDLKTFMDQVWPDMKWGLYDGSQDAVVTITFSTADYPGDTPRDYSFTVTQGTQFVTPRFRARLVSIKVESNDINSFWRVGNIRYRYQPDGKF
jgi:hypothetical protein